MYFDTGRSEIRPITYPILEVIGRAIAFLQESMEIFIMVEGHTDNVPITGRYMDNWALSNARAASVLRHLTYYLDVIAPERISAVGFGEYRPVATNDTAEGRQLNRRVVIRITQAGQP
ncbi:MAG: OmpA family protein [Clostridiales bacterium]|nr:OmpA family protein [Clostridiales bacterium]